MSGPTRRRADAIVVAAGRSSPDGRAPTSSLAPIGGRPLLALDARRARRGPRRSAAIVVVTSPDRRRALEDGSWLPAGASVAFVDRRARVVRSRSRPGSRPSSGSSPIPTGGASSSSTTARGRSSRRRSSRPSSTAAARARRRDPGRAGRRDAQAGRRATASRRPSTGPASPPRRRRRASGRGLLRDALALARGRRDGTWTDEAALLEACRIPVHVVPGDPDNLKVTVPADLARAAELLDRPVATRRTGIGHDAHPFGPGEPLRARRHRDRRARRGCTVTPTATSSLHAVADALLGRGRAGRPRSPVPGRRASTPGRRR